jgi:hypothetical protein
MQAHIDAVLQGGSKMEQLLTVDPECILAFSAMVTDCNTLVSELGL